ncbi:MAG: M15 family metallopeptidase [Oscillospiraceae bacterium]
MKKILDVILSLALVAGLGFGGYYIISNGTVIDQTTTYYDPDAQPITEEVTEPENQSNILFESEEVPNTEVNNSPLILVNSNFACNSEEANLVSLYVKRLEADSHSFGVRDEELLVREIMADALIRMFDDFNAATQADNVVVVSGFRTAEDQQRLYEEDLEETGLDYSEKVAPAGYSEHQTGWCVDLDIDGDEEFDGTDVQSWILENCYKYGMVLRYPEGKQEITGIQYEPWHFRYVGFPHATIMSNEGMCLEEYTDFLKGYPYDGNHLQVTDYDGRIYEIFYYPMDTEFESTLVPIPIGLDYEICGNNIDGFIVTVDTGEYDETEPIPAEDEEIAGDADPEQPDDWSEEPEFEEIPDGDTPDDEVAPEEDAEEN